MLLNSEQLCQNGNKTVSPGLKSTDKSQLWLLASGFWPCLQASSHHQGLLGPHCHSRNVDAHPGPVANVVLLKDGLIKSDHCYKELCARKTLAFMHIHPIKLLPSSIKFREKQNCKICNQTKKSHMTSIPWQKESMAWCPGPHSHLPCSGPHTPSILHSLTGRDITAAPFTQEPVTEPDPAPVPLNTASCSTIEGHLL